MKTPTPERRRSQRIPIPGDGRVRLGVSFPAQVLEISPSGVLLASKTEAAIGERGELRARVGNRALHVVIEIRAVSQETQARGEARFRIGAAFVAMTAEQRVLLLEVLGVERE